MPEVSCLYGPHGWWVRVMLPNGKETARFGPFTEGERNAFLEGAEAFATPHVVTFNTSGINPSPLTGSPGAISR